MSHAVLPGSFDPITKGHLDVIRRASLIFDKVTVAVMNNSEKSYLYSLEKRKELAEISCGSLPNVTVISSEKYLADLFDDISADIIVKGIRNENDLAYELKQAYYNKARNARAETMYLPSSPEYVNVSSTLVREKLANNDTLDGLVDDDIIDLL